MLEVAAAGSLLRGTLAVVFILAIVVLMMLNARRRSAPLALRSEAEACALPPRAVAPAEQQQQNRSKAPTIKRRSGKKGGERKNPPQIAESTDYVAAHQPRRRQSRLTEQQTPSSLPSTPQKPGEDEDDTFMLVPPFGISSASRLQEPSFPVPSSVALSASPSSRMHVRESAEPAAQQQRSPSSIASPPSSDASPASGKAALIGASSSFAPALPSPVTIMRMSESVTASGASVNSIMSTSVALTTADSGT